MPTWMVVEDEPDIYELLLAMFEIWGIEGVAFVDGAEAISWIEDVDGGRVRGDLPELALIDIRLPDPEIGGPEVAARLRTSPRLRHMPIVLITAYRLSAEQEADVMTVSQADELMYKPLPGMVELREKLGEIIVKRKAVAASEAQPEAAPKLVSPVPDAAPAPVPVKPVAHAPDHPAPDGTAEVEQETPI